MLCFILAGITLRVIPSNVVSVNQSVTLQCELDPNPLFPIVVSFRIDSPSTILCHLEPSNGVCKKTTDPCGTLYNASCPSDTRYRIQVTVSKNWNDVPVVCQTLYNRSNKVVFSVKGIVLI